MDPKSTTARYIHEMTVCGELIRRLVRVDPVERRRDRLTALPAVGFGYTSFGMRAAPARNKDPLLERQNSPERKGAIAADGVIAVTNLSY